MDSMPDPDHGLFVGQSPRNLMASPPSRPHPLNLVTTSPSVGRREVSGHPLALQSLPGISQESTFNSSVLSSPVFNGNTSVNSANVDWSSPWRSGQVSSVMLNPGSRSNVLSTPEVPRHHPQQIRQHQQDSGKRGRPRADEIRELIQEGSSSPSEIKCRTCHRVFPREKSLQAHMRTHTGEKPYLCDYPRCLKSFTQSGQLKTHQRLHAGEKPFQCSAEGCPNRYTHANRTCPAHPNFKPIRSPQLIMHSLPHNPNDDSPEVRQWLDKYYRERVDKTGGTKVVSSPVQPDLASSPILPQQQQPPQQLLPLPLQDLSKRSTKRGLVTELNQQENRFSDASENSFLDPVENSTPVKMPCRRQLDERLAGFPGTPLREEKTPLKSNVMATPQRQEQVQQQHPETPRSSRPSLADITSLDSNSKRVVISPDSNRPVQQKKRWLMQAAMEQATKTAILQFNSPTSTGTLSPSRTNNMGPEELAREIVWSHDEKQEPKEIPHRGRSPLKSSSSSVVRGPEALQSPRRRRERSPDTMTVAAALVYMGNDKETAAMGQEQQQQHAQAAPSQLNLEDERQLQQLPSEDVPLNLSMPKIIDY